ncbi:hypothetical protein KAW50_03605 [candidate division WOR-3 bacterium]|nr:hypothetical protein [candidate division WOR-3 bacterium]
MPKYKVTLAILIAFLLGSLFSISLFYKGYGEAKYHLEWRWSFEDHTKNCLYWYVPTSKHSATLHSIICIPNSYKEYK